MLPARHVMVRALLIGWLLMGLVAQVWGGPPGGRVDSLVRVLQVAADDAARQRVLLELAYEYSLSKPREGQRYAKQALALARTRGDAAGLTKIYLQLGQLASNENDIEEARGWYEKALALARTRGDSVAMGVSQANLANYYCNTGDNRKALDLAFAVTRGGARPGRERAMVLAYTVIGRVHDLQGDRLRARAYYLKALAAAGPEDAGARESSLFNLGLVSATLDSPAAALRYFERSGEIARQEGDTGQLGLVFLGKGQVYEQNLRDLPRAVAHYRQGLEVFRRIGDSVNLAQAALAVAVVQRLQGRAGAAVPLLEEALGIARRSGVAPVQLAVQEELHANAEARGDLAKALAHYRAYVKLNDSLRNSENDRHLAQLESQYEFAEKNKKIALLSAERRVQEKQVALQRLVTYGLLVGLVLVLGVVALLWQRYRLIRKTSRVVEAEKQRSEELLLNILPAEMAQELKETGHARARHHELVTVLFGDVENFTHLAERLPPEQLVSALDAYFVAFDRISERLGLEKIKTIGDAYMLAGGLREGEGAEPAAVVRAALAMQAAAGELRQEREAAGEPWFRLRIGIHTGPVVAGIVGIKKFAYDIWGDTVNTAARMEQAGEPGRINISEATYELVRERFVCVPRGRVAAKNKGEVAMYFVESERVKGEEGVVRSLPGQGVQDGAGAV